MNVNYLVVLLCFFFLSRSYPCLRASSFPTLSIRSSRLSQNVVNIFSPLESDPSHAHTPFAIRAQILSYSPPESIMYRYVLVGGYLIRYFSTASACFQTLALTFLFLLSGCFLLTRFSLRFVSLNHSVCFRFHTTLSIKLRYRAQVIEL